MIRVLALHGFGQNAEIFQKRTKDRGFEAESAESTFETFLEHFQSSIPRTSNPEKSERMTKDEKCPILKQTLPYCFVNSGSRDYFV